MRAVISGGRDYARKPIGIADGVLREDAAQSQMVFGEMSISLVASTLPKIEVQAL